MKRFTHTAVPHALSLCLCLMAAFARAEAPAAATAAAPPSITIADKPVRLIRGVTAYKGVLGTALQKDDIVETGATGIQIEAGPNALVAVGPQTRLYVLGLAGDDKSSTVLVLLEGWIKLVARTARPAAVGTPVIHLSVASGASVVHASADKGEMFAEEGQHIVAKVDDKGKPGALTKVAGEQYAFANATQPLQVLARPASDFLKTMPPAFRDRLVAVPRPSKPAKPAPPVKERDVDYADVAPWLQARLQVRRALVTRFKPRLADPAFRSQLEQELGQTPEWKAILYPPPAARSATPSYAPQ